MMAYPHSGVGEHRYSLIWKDILNMSVKGDYKAPHVIEAYVFEKYFLCPKGLEKCIGNH